jgi:signal transduction histidine kinase
VALRAGTALDNSTLFLEAQRLNRDLEQRVKERTAELTASNSELEAFGYSVSHDLRGPLRSVDGFSRSLLEDFGDHLDETAKDYIGRIRAAAKRMDGLITSLLSLSRITRAEIVRHEVDISALAEQSVHDASTLYPGVEVDIQPDMHANADSKMLHAVLDNLVSNAMKFSSKNPHPKMTVGSKDGAFFVQDNGVGFNTEYEDKLFAPFERLHSSKEFPGSGIGLATVQRIILRHGGRVWAESVEGKGATFYFTLD